MPPDWRSGCEERPFPIGCVLRQAHCGVNAGVRQPSILCPHCADRRSLRRELSSRPALRGQRRICRANDLQHWLRRCEVDLEDDVIPSVCAVHAVTGIPARSFIMPVRDIRVRRDRDLRLGEHGHDAPAGIPTRMLVAPQLHDDGGGRDRQNGDEHGEQDKSHVPPVKGTPAPSGTTTVRQDCRTAPERRYERTRRACITSSFRA